MSYYEQWTGKKPRINHLRIVRSVCYTHIPKQRRRERDNKAIQAYFIEYDGKEKYNVSIKELRVLKNNIKLAV